MWPVAQLKDSRPQLFPATLSCLKPLGHFHMQQSERQGDISDPQSPSDQSRMAVWMALGQQA